MEKQLKSIMEKVLTDRLQSIYSYRGRILPPLKKKRLLACDESYLRSNSGLIDPEDVLYLRFENERSMPAEPLTSNDHSLVFSD